MLQQEGLLLRSSFLLNIFAGFVLHSLAVSEIPLGSKLSVVGKNIWVSPNGDFAFGFFNRTDEPNYSVGIHFNSKSIPLGKQTLVWTAGANIVVGEKSYAQLTQDGELVIIDSLKGVAVWSSRTSQLSVVSAALHDNGNLVLLNEEKHIVWQSFNTPSDTLLPGQNFSRSQMLRAASKNLVSDYMSSYYTLFMNGDGQLQLRWESHFVYWTSGSAPSSNITAFLTSEGALQLCDQNLNPVWSMFGEDYNDSVSYRFLRLDVDGNLRLYSWDEASMTWRAVWQAVENQCNVFATCGQRGICFLTESGSPDCKCPFNPVNGSTEKCLIASQRCKSGSSLFSYKHTVLYGMYNSTDDLVVRTSLQQCRSLCLRDPLCTAATFSNDGTTNCLMKRKQYVTGYSDPSLSSVSFVKVCADPLAVNPNPNLSLSSPSAQKFCLPCLIGAASVAVFLLFQLALGFWFYRRRKRRRILVRKKASFAHTSSNSNGLIMLSFSEIEDFTENFKHQIGQEMFKAVLPEKEPVAIKKMNVSAEERKYRSAVSMIGGIHHKNLVKLQGYCCELNHRFLIYEYVKNGSVEKHIEDHKLCKRLTWGKRVDICLGVARAISYLHTSCRKCIIHGNLRCKDVLLDENLEAKVTGFGLGAIIGNESSSSAMKDVEDFGRMVLVLVSGCREVGDLCEWAYKEWSDGHPENVVDRRLGGMHISQELERVLRIAFWCLQIDEFQRPSMTEVVMVLEGTSSVDPPPPPFA
ncbi:G-type lectin S-receptor-like serine/threonine-protein kinase SD3-1 [Argentina anserina]|uniref:G-type lectin S-receptor-like serine/threonine-protein kinase SD3-1 n=1 Tax=Argentina anserina TaxID=57926 RepID=UPI00217632E7|nr:G-type lectin S-receptor-like serine/threonine-protein kinase SD3-1 [Potentilla anserina]